MQYLELKSLNTEFPNHLSRASGEISKIIGSTNEEWADKNAESVFNRGDNMTTSVIRDRNDLIEKHDRTDASIYGLKSSYGLLDRLKRESIGEVDGLRWAPSLESKVLGHDGASRWIAKDLPQGTVGWIFGSFTTSDESALESSYFGSRILDAEMDLLPDVFVTDGLKVSESARQVLEEVAPDSCYFVKYDLQTKGGLKPVLGNYYHVYIRDILAYKGPWIEGGERPSTEIVSLKTWPAYKMSAQIQRFVCTLPIFVFDKSQAYPIVGKTLLAAWDEAGMSGLLEMQGSGSSTRRRSQHWADFEVVLPLK